MDIYVDGLKTDTWTSSGTTAAFETVKLGFHYTSSTSSYSCDHPGVAVESTIELRGVLADSEWLSILEVGWAGSVQLVEMVVNSDSLSIRRLLL